MKAIDKPKSIKPAETQAEQPGAISADRGRPLASSPLVVSLLIILLAAVVIQGVALLTVANSDRVVMIEDDSVSPRTAPDAEAAPALVKKPSAAATSQDTQLPSASPLSSAPLGSMLTDDFFGDDWQPFAEMARMRERMDRLFEDSFQRFRSIPGFEEEWLTAGATSEPAIADEGDHYLVTLDLPGADESSLDIRLEDDVLTISGRREEVVEQRDESGTVTTRSQSTSSFQRSFSLPGETAVAGLSSDYQNGILSITVPKASA